MTLSDPIAELGDFLGLERSYKSFAGDVITAGQDTHLALLAALGFPVTTPDDARAHLGMLRAEKAARLSPPEVLLPMGAASGIDLRAEADWALWLEDASEPAASGLATRQVPLPPLPAGIHRLELTHARGTETTWILASPGHAPSLHDLTGRDKAWGVTAALFGLNSPRNAGLGDYTDLGATAEALGGLGAAFLGINPVHAPGYCGPTGLISPYSPSHRSFVNSWHIALDDLVRFGGSQGAVLPPPPRTGDLIDYAASARHRDRSLKQAFMSFQGSPESGPAQQGLAAYVAEAGPDLVAFATFEAISEMHGPDWQHWPKPLQDSQGEACRTYAARNGTSVRFHLWLQWVAHSQLAGAQARARAGGMTLGLYLDYAVGARPGGAETWMGRDSHVTGVSLGAPPDPLSSLGQSWGLAPLSPHGLARSGYAGFVKLLRGVTRYGGMVRIDHVLGLRRSFWIPENGAPGGYVTYPFQSLLTVLAIEAHRSRTLVVGEDLGLVPEGLREALERFGIYGLDIIQFQMEDAGQLPAPADFRRKALAGFGTHDTPTIAGFMSGRDLETLHDLGHMETEDLEQRRLGRQTLAEAIGAPGDLVARVHECLAQAPSELVSIQLDDITGEVDQQNLPGTIDEFPNWRRRHSVATDDISALAPARDLSRIMAAAGRNDL